jgi:hypothetical protein
MAPIYFHWLDRGVTLGEESRRDLVGLARPDKSS